MTCRVIPAMREGSPAPSCCRRLNQFQYPRGWRRGLAPGSHEEGVPLAKLVLLCRHEVAASCVPRAASRIDGTPSSWPTRSKTRRQPRGVLELVPAGGPARGRRRTLPHRRDHRQVMRTHSVDDSRVYVPACPPGSHDGHHERGYPDLYAAAGVHSGLPCGAATTSPQRSRP